MPLQALMLMIIPRLTEFFTSVIFPVAGQLLKFTLPRIIKLPRYFQLLWTIYQDSGTNAEARKYLTSALIILSSILTFMAYSYIPLTGMPIIGVFTTPVAGMIAIVISLASLDVIFKINTKYLSSKYPDDFAFICSEIDELTNILGNSWEDMVKQTQALLDTVKKNIDPNENYDDTIVALINSLISYLGTPSDDGSLTPDEIKRRIIAEGLPPVAKIGGSIAEGVTAGAIAGAGAHGAATSMLVQAGFWTSLKTTLGLTSGIAVSASAYSLLTVAAPIGVAVVACVGASHGAKLLRDQSEKRKLSVFVADVLIAALPVAWIDSEFSPNERDTFEKLLLNSAINETDVKRVREAMIQHQSFEDILRTGLLKEENPDKARLKYRLLLCTAWELAKADGVISTDEIDLHNRMAKFMNIESEEVNEIRRLILLKSGINIRDRIAVIQGDITQESVDAIVNSANKTLIPSYKLGWTLLNYGMISSKLERIFNAFKCPFIPHLCNALSWLSLSGKHKNVDTAIHLAAGASLQKICQNLNGCDVGKAKITQGYNLLSPWVIHTVSPTWTSGKSQEEELLAQCYRNSLKLAHENSISTIAFPALGSGTGGFPIEQAAKIAITEVMQFLNTHFSIEKVKFVCLNEQIYQVYLQAVDEIVGCESVESLERLRPESTRIFQT